MRKQNKHHKYILGVVVKHSNKRILESSSFEIERLVVLFTNQNYQTSIYIILFDRKCTASHMLGKLIQANKTLLLVLSSVYYVLYLEIGKLIEANETLLLVLSSVYYVLYLATDLR